MIFEVIWYIQCTSLISLEEGFHNTLSMTIWHLETPDVLIQVEPHPGVGSKLEKPYGAGEARERSTTRLMGPSATLPALLHTPAVNPL